MQCGKCMCKQEVTTHSRLYRIEPISHDGWLGSVHLLGFGIFILHLRFALSHFPGNHLGRSCPFLLPYPWFAPKQTGWFKLFKYSVFQAFPCFAGLSFLFVSLYLWTNCSIHGEAPWSSGERQGLTVWAMVLRCGFNSWVHLKTRWISWTTWWQKKNENNKDSQKGQVTSK